MIDKDSILYAQDKRSVMYLGNWDGMLEYDGVSCKPGQKVMILRKKSCLVVY